MLLGSWRQPPCILRRVIVNCTHDPSEAFEGVLWSYRGGWFTLRDVSGLKAGQAPARVNGDVVIHRDHVAYLQVVAS